MSNHVLTFNFLFLMLWFQTGFGQNVGINATGDAPDPSAGLDVSFSNKGILIPRVALTGTNDVTTVPVRANSLLVYNEANVVGTYAVTPGFYYWNSNIWTRLASGGTGPTSLWTQNGTYIYNNNSGTVNIGGTTDLAAKLGIDAGSYQTGLSLIGANNNYFEFNMQNTANGVDSSTDIVATANNGTDASNYINMGINSLNYRVNGGGGQNRILNGPNKAYIYAVGKEMYVGNGSYNQPLIFFTNLSTQSDEDAVGTERMRITGPGEVWMGFTADQGDYRLQVNGKTLMDGDVTVGGHILPSTGIWDLGASTSTSTRWRTVYTQNILNTSDRRAKTNIANATYGLKEVLGLQPVTYNWKDTPDTNKQVGLIAQDVRELIPEAVKGDESKETLSMDYNALVPVLINAIKDQQKRIDELEKLVNKLQSK